MISYYFLADHTNHAVTLISGYFTVKMGIFYKLFMFIPNLNRLNINFSGNLWDFYTNFSPFACILLDFVNPQKWIVPNPLELGV